MVHVTIGRCAGQGCNLALEDALELGHAIRREGLTEAALRSYEVPWGCLAGATVPRAAASIQTHQAARIPRVLDVLQHGTDFSAVADRERVVYGHAFQSLQPRVVSRVR